MRLPSKSDILLIIVALSVMITIGAADTQASIGFSNGFWSSTFDCNDWQSPNSLSCDGISKNLDTSCSGNWEQITSAANNPYGDGGKGQRHWYGTPKNMNSGGTYISFNSPQSEVWVRWYQKYDSRMTSGLQHTNKMLYFDDSGGQAINFGFAGSDGYRFWVVQNDTGQITPQSSTGYGWNSLIKDGTWNSFEIHMKLDTNNSNGILEVWINGNRVMRYTNLDTGRTSRGGWTGFILGANHDFFTNSCYPNDIDDIAIALPSYGGFTQDSNGNRMIGTIGSGGGSTPPPPPPTPTPVVANPRNLSVVAASGGTGSGDTGSGTINPQIFFEENFDNANFSSRGWYDNTNLNISTTEHISGSTGSVEFRFNQGATTPTSGSAIRRKFTATEEVYLSYYVKYSSTWTGSNQSYHPHQFFIMTNKDDDWAAPNRSHMTFYVEENEGVPQVAICDGANIDESNINVNLTGVTENRAVAGCNGNSDGYPSSCYSLGSEHNNWKQWQAGGVFFQDAQGPYYKGDWHRVEAYIKMNSIVGGRGQSDGVIKYWYDGNLIIDHSDVIFRTAQHADMKFDKILIAPYIGDGSPVTQTLWIDAFKLGN